MRPAAAALITATSTLLAQMAQSGPALFNDGVTITRMLSGNSVVGAGSDGAPFCTYFDTGGAGWNVWENYLCTPQSGDAETCRRALIRDRSVAFVDARDGRAVSGGTIVAGDACN